MSDQRWTEGIRGDGSAILYDGVPVSISCVLETLNAPRAAVVGGKRVVCPECGGSGMVGAPAAER